MDPKSQHPSYEDPKLGTPIDGNSRRGLRRINSKTGPISTPKPFRGALSPFSDIIRTPSHHLFGPPAGISVGEPGTGPELDLATALLTSQADTSEVYGKKAKVYSMCTYIHTYTYMYICVRMYVYMYTTYMCVCTYMSVCTGCVYI